MGAFFDVDKTILSHNSGALYMRALYDRGEVEWPEMLSNLGSYLRYKLDLLDIERWTKQMLRRFEGQSEKSLIQEAESWFSGYVRPTIYAEAL